MELLNINIFIFNKHKKYLCAEVFMQASGSDIIIWYHRVSQIFSGNIPFFRGGYQEKGMLSSTSVGALYIEGEVKYGLAHIIMK